MNNADVFLLEAAGWVVECESPLEIRHSESNSFATNRAAEDVLQRLKIEPAVPHSEFAAVQSTAQALEELMTIAGQMQKIADVAASKDNYETWKLAYGMVFNSSARERFGDLLRELGLELTWTDPDCDYKNDVLAYTGALCELIGRLNPMLDGLNSD
jgi:hypothetical protein